MTIKLTKKIIDTLAYEGNGKSKDVRWDSTVTGFGIRIYPTGKKAFIVLYRQQGKQRLMTLGQYGKITLDQAKDLARKRFGEVADGEDPLDTKQAHKKKHEWTVDRAFNQFLVRYAKPRNKSWKETERIFKSDVLSKLGKRPIDEVKRDDILKLLDSIVDRGSGTMANRTLAHIRKFFNWCIERGLIEHAPTHNISAPAPSVKRDRILSDQEIKEVWTACDRESYPCGTLFQFLLATGQRRGETAVMKWEDIDEEQSLWTIPKETTKSGRSHEVPLPSLAIDILDSIPRSGKYVFTSSGNIPFDNIQRGKKRIDSFIKKSRTQDNQRTIPHWRVHDLRRTVASGMARLKIQPHVIEKVQNRTSGIISGVSALYNRYTYSEEKQEAIDLWGKYLDKLINKDE